MIIVEIMKDKGSIKIDEIKKMSGPAGVEC
jgi:hypothetical protein